MNTVKINNKLYKYESFFVDSKSKKIVDYNNNPFPVPVDSKIIWQNKEQFIAKLLLVQKYLENKPKFIHKNLDRSQICLLDKKKINNKILYELNGIRWESGLVHYIEKHNWIPTDDFVDYIFRIQIKPNPKYNKIIKLKGLHVKKTDKIYLKLDRNQILIMDALMEHGGKHIYKDKFNNKLYRYSEHSGLLDFNDDGLERIIISGNTTRVDTNDDDIFLPRNMLDAIDYEYMFHTHPPTPTPGFRAKLGILYEFPSISDLFNFMDHYNDGLTQGSIVLTPEGLYIIHKYHIDDQKIIIDENQLYKEINKTMWTEQKKAIKKYGLNFNIQEFYSEIAQNKSFINNLNKILNKYELHIEYYSRIYDMETQSWILDTIYLPIYVIEPQK